MNGEKFPAARYCIFVIANTAVRVKHGTIDRFVNELAYCNCFSILSALSCSKVKLSVHILMAFEARPVLRRKLATTKPIKMACRISSSYLRFFTVHITR